MRARVAKKVYRKWTENRWKGRESTLNTAMMHRRIIHGGNKWNPPWLNGAVARTLRALAEYQYGKFVSE